jgi:hypothetical protein
LGQSGMYTMLKSKLVGQTNFPTGTSCSMLVVLDKGFCPIILDNSNLHSIDLFLVLMTFHL